jgi:hypothetical protein
MSKDFFADFSDFSIDFLFWKQLFDVIFDLTTIVLLFDFQLFWPILAGVSDDIRADA